MDHNTLFEMQYEPSSDIPLSLWNTMASDVPVKEKEEIGCTDSFHVGAPNSSIFDTGFMRLFNTAIIELEYVFATAAAGML